MLASMILSSSLYAGYRTTVSQLWTLTSNTDCVSYLVTVWNDNGSNNPQDWRAMAAKVILSEGCNGIDPGESGQPVATNHYAVIQGTSQEDTCVLVSFNIYDESSVLTAQGKINLCDGMLSSKKGVSQYSNSRLKVFLYPTVVNRDLNIVHPSGLEANINIYNSSRQLLKSIETNNSLELTSLNLQDLKAGMYFIIIESNQSVLFQQKIIKS